MYVVSIQGTPDSGIRPAVNYPISTAITANYNAMLVYSLQTLVQQVRPVLNASMS